MTEFEKRLVNSEVRSRSVAKRIAERLEALRPTPGRTCLDLGCGNGAAAIEIAERFGLTTVGVDVDPDQIDRARRTATQADVRFEAADAERLPFPDDAFDFIVCYRVTHHIPRWRAALAEAFRVTAPGGCVLYTDFMTPGWAAAVGARVFPRALGFPTRRGVAALVERFGLEPIAEDHSFMNLDAVWRKPG